MRREGVSPKRSIRDRLAPSWFWKWMLKICCDKRIHEELLRSERAEIIEVQRPKGCDWVLEKLQVPLYMVRA